VNGERSDPRARERAEGFCRHAASFEDFEWSAVVIQKIKLYRNPENLRLLACCIQGANAADEDRTLTVSLQRAIRKVEQRKSA
jgi:hypothetical protein